MPEGCGAAAAPKHALHPWHVPAPPGDQPRPRGARQGKKKAVVRDFIVARQAVRLYVDFVEPQLRKTPLVKKPRKDGLSNLERDLSDDEYEDPPEAKSQARPQSSRPSTPRASPRATGHGKQVEAQRRKRECGRTWTVLKSAGTGTL